MTAIDDNPMQWTEGYVVFDGAMGVPMVFKLTDPETGLNVERAALISKTLEPGRAMVRKVFGAASQTPGYPDRFPLLSMRLDGCDNCAAGLAQLKERLNIEVFYDGERLWYVRELQ